MAHPSYDPYHYVPSRSNVNLYDPNNRYAYLRVDQFVVDDISDLLGQEVNGGVIPVENDMYRITMISLSTIQYTHDMNITVDIYDRVRAILDHAGCRPSFVTARQDLPLANCMPDLENCLLKLALRVFRLESACLSRV